jgi:hypothetical protein
MVKRVQRARRRGRRSRAYIVLLIAIVAVLVLATCLHYISQNRVTAAMIFTKLYEVELRSGVPMDVAGGVPHMLVIETGAAKAGGEAIMSVPLYLGTSVYGHVYVNASEWRDIWGLLQVKLGLAGNATLKAIVVGGANDKSFWSSMLSGNRIAIAFGHTGCSFCQAMHEFFKENFSDKVYFLWIDKD